MKNSELLKFENRIVPLVVAFLLIAVVSGLIHMVVLDLSVFSQVNLIMHVAVGMASFLVSGLYCYWHFRRTIGVRKPIVNASGMMSAVFLLAYFSVSVWISIEGHKEVNQYLFNIHQWGGLLIALLIAIHMVAFKALKYGKLKKNEFTFIKNQEKSRFYRSVFLIVITYCILLLCACIWNYLGQPKSLVDVSSEYELVYGSHPFKPSQTETKDSKFIHPDYIANSERCAQCHQDIFEQWISSTHRLAAADPTYVTNITLLAEKKGIAATRYCEGCHAPVALLTGQLTEGGDHGGVPNTPANHEGVGCVSCHRAIKPVHLEGVASYFFEPHRPYLFDGVDNALFSSINSMLMRLYAGPHKADMGTEFVTEPASCATCHSQFMNKEMNDWGWVKMQDEYRAWLSSPFSKQGDPVFGGNEGKRCQDCHMPLVDAVDPSSDENGKVRSHRFAAANTMLPYLNGDQVQLSKTIDFLRSNKIQVNIEEPRRADATQSKLTVNESLREHDETPFYLYLNEKVELKVTVSNTGVGHNFPGGTTDINQAWLDLTVIDAEGHEIYRSGAIGEDDVLDPSALVYQSVPIDRFGNHVWKHDLFNMVGRTYKKVIESGKSDIAAYQFEVPSWAKGPITVMATVRYRKLNTRYAKWALKDLYVSLPVVDMARDVLIIDIVEEPPALNRLRNQ